MNEKPQKEHLKLCGKCLRKALKAQYEIELNTHAYAADWTWRTRLWFMGVLLNIIRWLTGIDHRFYLITMDRGKPKWQNVNQNAKLRTAK